MLKREISCSDIEQLIEVVALLTARGLGFEADAERLIVKLTGAY